ncbi:uncharacterized protein LOC111870711 isoform X2 [Cryptotermes secundus]|uniref:uncharacterized protein LOC111870711 isoform X2 n=1 Tax=Cryptotermes secundus TaxID=105785 RepID=UPI000CD7DFB3|nr:uncharacterized protein LOC111870711 isoform X2 [Cryptotermes secundus]
MASRLLILLLTVVIPVAATSGNKTLRNWVTAGCVVILVTVVLLLIMWKCISHLKKRDEMQSLQNTSSDCDVEISSPRDPLPLQVIWPGSKTQSPQQVCVEVSSPAYPNLVFKEKCRPKCSKQDAESKIFMII